MKNTLESVKVMSTLERGESFLKAFKSGHSAESISEAAKVALPTVYNGIKLAKLPEGLKMHMKSGKINTTDVLSLIRKSDSKPDNYLPKLEQLMLKKMGIEQTQTKEPAPDKAKSSTKPKAENKPKRKRRTKVEMEAARKFETKVASKPKAENKPKRKRRTKVEMEAAREAVKAVKNQGSEQPEGKTRKRSYSQRLTLKKKINALRELTSSARKAQIKRLDKALGLIIEEDSMEKVYEQLLNL